MTSDGGPFGGSLPFRKMHGLGNDFVIIDQRGAGNALAPALVRAIGDRHRGVGFDQLAEIRLPSGSNADAEIVFWNADGSQAGACGNATRCVADLLMAETGAGELALRTGNGILTARRAGDGRISVDMGKAHLGWAEIPLARESDTLALPLDGTPVAVGMGNPHAVFFVEDAEAVDLEREGPRWEHDPLFPERINVEFCHVIDRKAIRMRVWERGGMITQACGSGACAAGVAAIRRGLTERALTVHLDGGPLDIEWREDGHVVMTGPVSYVFEGVLSPAFLSDHG